MNKLARLLIFLFLVGCSNEPKKEEQKPAPSSQPDTMQAMEPPSEPKTADETPKEEPKKPPATISKPSIERNVTVVGDIVDIVSYATAGVIPMDAVGKEIAEASAKGGNPLGIREESTGEVYVVTMKQANTSANATLLPFIGTKIAAKGDVYRKGQQRLLILSVVGKRSQ